MNRLLSAVVLCIYSFSCMSFAHAMEQNPAQIVPEKTVFEHVTENNWEKVKEMVLADRALLDTRDFLQRSLLIRAVIKKNMDAVIFIIKKCPDLVFCLDNTGRLPIHMAADCGNQEICEALIVHPQLTEDFVLKSSILKKAFETLLLIRKCPASPLNTLALLPRRLILGCICKPLEDELLAEHIVSHKNAVFTMLSQASVGRGLTPAATAQDRGHNNLVSLLDPQSAAEWDQKIEDGYKTEDCYKIIKN